MSQPSPRVRDVIRALQEARTQRPARSRAEPPFDRSWQGALVLILAALCIVIAVCFGALRRREAELRSPQRATGTGTAGSISGDEIIDVHLALKDLSSLREIAERIAA